MTTQRIIDIINGSLDARQRQRLASCGWVIAGCIVYAVGVNVIITPVGLYNGGFMGIAQLLRLFCSSVLGISFPPGIDIVGVIYFVINLPLFFMAYRMVGKAFCIRSVITIGLSSLALALITVPDHAIIEDTFTACFVGGVVAGSGAGMVLRSGSSAGGQDIIGVCMSFRNPNYSVGGISILINTVVYGICFFLFDFQVVLYSLIHMMVLAVFLDRMHVQNINVEALIFTKKEGIAEAILNEMHRGLTKWEGAGGYTNEASHILVTVLSKYEVNKLIAIVRRYDDEAFVVVTEGTKVYGNYHKPLS